MTKGSKCALGALLAATALAVACGDSLTDVPQDVLEPQQALGVPYQIEIVSAQRQAGRPGLPVADPPRVRVVDDLGFGVPNVNVRFRVIQGGGSTDPVNVATDLQGYASTVWTLGPNAGQNRVRVVVRGLENVRFTADAIDAEPASVVVQPAAFTLDAFGATRQLVATVRDGAGEPVPEPVTWRVHETAFATVDSTGVVRAVRNGTTLVIAQTADGLADTSVVTIDQRTATVSVTPTTDTIDVSEALQLTARARDANGHLIAGAAFQWATESAAVATVSQTGVVRGVSAGSTGIVATSEGVSDRARIAVQADGAPAGAAFFSDWSTATGQSDAAIRDTNQRVPWSSVLNNGDALTVIPSTGLDFPTANVLRVDAVSRGGDGAYAANPRVNNLPIPAVGGSLYYRWFIRVAMPDRYTGDVLTHPIQDGMQGGSTNWMFEVHSHSNGTWTPGWNVNGPGTVNAWPNNRWQLNTALQKNRTYRIEARVQRTGTSTWTLNARIFDAAGNLLFDEADFLNANRTANLGSRPQFSFNSINYLSSFQCGLNGLSAGAASEFPFVVSYQGGFEIRTDGWAGAIR